MAKVKEIFEWMDDRYPFALAENYDNCGLLIGDTERVVSRCMLALDVTGEVLADAICWQADLIITHHPVIFNALKRLSVGDIPYECIRHGIAVLSSHTCLDRAIGGVNDALSECLSLQNVTILDETDGFLRTGILPKVMEPVEFAAYCKKTLSSGGIRAVLGERSIGKVGLCSGAGGSFVGEAIEAGCDAYLTGEVKHHEAIIAKNAGITLIDAGHFETETVVLPQLEKKLKSAFPEIEFSISAANQPVMEWL